MITAVVYSESGGTFKTVTTANVSAAMSRMGLDVLVIDLDPQEANLTRLLGVDAPRQDPSADNLVRHILDQPDGDFKDLIMTTDEGVDIVPSHNMLSDFTSNLEQKITYETGMNDMTRDEYPRFELLYDLLWDKEELHKSYDAILIDPNARAEDLLYNAIYALRTLVAPVKPAGKGNLSLDGLDEMVGNLEETLDVEVGLSCVVPTRARNTNAHKGYKKEFEASDDLPTPVSIANRESLMDEMWEAEGSAFKVIQERWKTVDKSGDDEDETMVSEPGRRRIRDAEVDTLQQIWNLAGYIATQTFDVQINREYTLDIDGYDNRTLQYQLEDAREVVP